MITRINPLRQVPPWQAELGRAISDPELLLHMLGLGSAWLAGARAAARAFPLRVPHGYVARMERGNPHDPLLRQVLPLEIELEPVPGFVSDPLDELNAMAVPGVLHKYRGRVLLVATGACAVHCRYCFRRHFPYPEANPAAGHWQAALDYVAADTGIQEVILSGGDPLSLSDRRLAELAGRLDRIAHLKRLRLHTRLPIALPERITGELLDWLGAGRLRKIVVVHANHPNELDAVVCRGLERLGRRGITLLNQAVLLRGVNDDAETLALLCERLFDAGVTPYYLHMLDPVHGASHFAVDEARALRLIARLSARLPGYLVPRLVRELPGANGKTPVSP